MNLHSRCCCCVVTWRGATPPRVDMRVRPFPWLSAASSGVPRLDGLLSTRVVTRLAGGLVGIKLDVVPAGAPISSWNCSSDGKFEDEENSEWIGFKIELGFVSFQWCHLYFCSSRTQSHYATVTFYVNNYDLRSCWSFCSLPEPACLSVAQSTKQCFAPAARF